MTSFPRTRAAATAALLLSSCGTTKLSQTWHDPADAPVLVNRVLVVAIQLPGETLEARFEDALAAVIRREGFRPLTASSTFAPRHLDRETMVKYMRDNGGDLAIQLEMVTGTSSTLIPASLAFANGPGLSGPPAVPSQAGDAYAGSPYGLGVAHVPGQVVEDRSVAAEIEVYRFPGATLAWRSMSRTADLKSEQDSAESLAEAVVKVLKADGVLVR
jgi:hypothetical protein